MFARLVALGLGLALAPIVSATAQPTPPAPEPPAATAPAKPDAGPKPIDAGEAVELNALPALTYRGETDWEDADKALSEAVNRLYATAAKAKLEVAGPPMIEYLDTSGSEFRFTGYLPLKAPVADPLPEPMAPGVTPTGSAQRFVHQGPYEDLDGVYASIESRLSAEGKSMKRVIEEYVSDPSVTDPDQMVTNIYVFTE
jgi:hypothetical protein